MGLAFRYRGEIDADCLPGMLAQAVGIAKDCGWEYATVENGELSEPVFPFLTREGKSPGGGMEEAEALNGILIRPELGCETLPLLFDQKRTLRDPSAAPARNASEEGWIRWQTEFIRIEAHVGMIELLKFLRRHFFARLDLVDEGRHWETGEGNPLESLGDRIAVLMGKLEPLLIPEEESFSVSVPNLRALAESIEETVREIWRRD